VTPIVLRSCTLRPFRQGDEDAISRNADDRRIWANMRDQFPHPYTLVDAERWVAFNLASATKDNVAIEVDGEVGGGIGIIPGADVYRRAAEIGYWLGARHWGKGIATDALRAMTEHVFATRDVVRLFAGVFEHNAASARVLEKAGYVLEGRMRKSVTKDGKTIDQLLYARVAP
jgi:RimJ/RimL family protein N-acetyltransferase